MTAGSCIVCLLVFQCRESCKGICQKHNKDTVTNDKDPEKELMIMKTSNEQNEQNKEATSLPLDKIVTATVCNAGQSKSIIPSAPAAKEDDKKTPMSMRTSDTVLKENEPEKEVSYLQLDKIVTEPTCNDGESKVIIDTHQMEFVKMNNKEASCPPSPSDIAITENCNARESKDGSSPQSGWKWGGWFRSNKK
ncbi:MAG: hypothetical protein QS748_06010 [Candidatus Endonucleobacter bathymodioli]|uniref:Uncharacterized protein n=1 Tax=Candidatus Endonucleibacter bathymodioli TaxID=539814 RepID=A0AA90NL67_9GAMM|nr:hypothetical protein [Candidatus Endonucleobacter bathymodioli]